MLQRVLLTICLLTISISLSGCAYNPFIYRVDVQQGNYYDPGMTSRLRVGMTKQQVLRIMGEPITVDTFRNNRWHYVYTLQVRGGCIHRKHVTILFDGDKVVNIDQVMCD